MPWSGLARIGAWVALAVLVIGAAGLTGLLVFGTVPRPKPLASISQSMHGVDFSDLPAPLSSLRFRARDGRTLHYRLYPGSGPDVVILIDGSSGESSAMHAVAKAIAAAGDTVFVPDLRGHGHDGTPGELDYIGQLDDDLADLVGTVHESHPDSGLILAGHSSGGGFVFRVAVSRLASLFDGYILLSPAMPYGGPTWRPDAGGRAAASTGRIVALTVLNAMGID